MRLLRNRSCYTLHVSECHELCRDCFRKKTDKHDCLTWRCYTCKTRVEPGHQCFKKAEAVKEEGQMFFAHYDLETALVKNIIDGKTVLVHVPVMACVTLRCRD